MDPVEGTPLGDLERTDLGIYTFNLVIRSSNVNCETVGPLSCLTSTVVGLNSLPPYWAFTFSYATALLTAVEASFYLQLQPVPTFQAT